MELSDQALEQIGSYVRRNLPAWLEGMEPRRWEMMIHERVVRVEEELKAQRELMREGFAAVDRRFEAVDKRFEDVNRRFDDMNQRFDDMHRHSTRWLTVITVFLAVIGLTPIVMELL